MEESTKIENHTLCSFGPRGVAGERVCLENGSVKAKIYWRAKIMGMRGGSSSPMMKEVCKESTIFKPVGGISSPPWVTL